MKRRTLVWCLAVFLTLTTAAGASAAGGWNGFLTVNLRMNGAEYSGTPPAILVEEHVFLPVRGVAEVFGAKAEWDETAQTLSIATTSTAGLIARAEAAETQVTSLRGELQRARDDLAKAQAKIRELEGAPGSQASPANRQELIAQLKGRVYRLDVYDWSGQLVSTGSAVAIGPTELVTNWHVVADAASVMAHGENDSQYQVDGLLAGREEHDLAIVKVKGTVSPVAIRQDEPKVGEDVLSIGSPRGLTNTVSTGIVSATRTWNGITVLQLTAPISPGSSGGGLFDKDGKLIGITFASMVEGQNLNFAIPIKVLTPLLSQAKVAKVQPLPGATQPTPSNVLKLISEKYPTFTVGGKVIYPKYELLPYENPPTKDHAPQFLAVGLDTEQYWQFIDGMLAGEFASNSASVEAYLTGVANLMSRAFKGKVVTVYLYHSGMYDRYPSWFDPEDIRPSNGQWQVTRGILHMWNPSGNGQWEYFWK